MALVFWFVRVLTLVKLLSSGDDFEINSSKFQDNSKFFFFSRMCRRVVYLFLLEREKDVKTPYKAAIRCLEGRIRLQNKIQSGLIARNKKPPPPVTKNTTTSSPFAQVQTGLIAGNKNNHHLKSSTGHGLLLHL